MIVLAADESTQPKLMDFEPLVDSHSTRLTLVREDLMVNMKAPFDAFDHRAKFLEISIG